MATQRTRRGFGAIRKLPSGRYQASYQGPDLVRHTAPETFHTKDAAVVWLSSERRKVEDTYAGGPTWTSPAQRVAVQRRPTGRETFGEYGTRWIAERRNAQGQPLRALTRKDYEQLLADYLAPTFGTMSIEDITRTSVRVRGHGPPHAPAPGSGGPDFGVVRAALWRVGRAASPRY
jgi:hypothetical protein